MLLHKKLLLLYVVYGSMSFRQLIQTGRERERESDRERENTEIWESGGEHRRYSKQGQGQKLHICFTFFCG